MKYRQLAVLGSASRCSRLARDFAGPGAFPGGRIHRRAGRPAEDRFVPGCRCEPDRDTAERLFWRALRGDRRQAIKGRRSRLLLSNKVRMVVGEGS